MKNAKELLLLLEQETLPEKQVDIIVDLTELFLSNDLVRCEAYAQKLLEIAKQHQLPEAEMHHYLVMGRIAYRKADLNASFDHYTKANEVAEGIGHLVSQANVLQSKGNLLHKWGRNDEALKNMFGALKIYEQEKVNNSLIGTLYNDIANTYDSLKQTSEAEAYYKLAIATLENSDKKQIIDFVKANLGLMLLNEKKFKEALVFFNKSLEGFLNANQIQAQGLTYHYLAQCLIGLNEHSKALEYYHQALKLFKHSRYYNELSVVYMGLGTFYQDLGGYSNTEVYFNKALDMRLMRGFWHGACEAYLALYKLYTVMGDKQVAHDMLLSGYNLAIEHQLPSWASDFEKLINEPSETEN